MCIYVKEAFDVYVKHYFISKKRISLRGLMILVILSLCYWSTWKKLIVQDCSMFKINTFSCGFKYNDINHNTAKLYVIYSMCYAYIYMICKHSIPVKDFQSNTNKQHLS